MFVSESNKVKSSTVIKNLQKRNMEGYYCETVEEAVEKAMSMIKQDDVVAWGGSTTIDQIGIKKLLEEKSIEVIDRDKVSDPKEKAKLMKKALTSDRKSVV